MKDYVIKQVIPVRGGCDYFAVYEVDDIGRIARPVDHLALVTDEEGSFVEGLVLVDGVFELSTDVYSREEISEKFPDIPITSY